MFPISLSKWSVNGNLQDRSIKAKCLNLNTAAVVVDVPQTA